jgi:hypothetical protein
MAHEGATIGLLLILVSAPACTPGKVFGPLQFQSDQRDELMRRAQGSGVAVELLNVIAPPLTHEELQAIAQQNGACRTAYMWKSALTWTGGVLVAVAAGVTIGGAYATGINDVTGKIVFGVSAGSLATLGGVFGVIGDIIHQYFTDWGCVVK